MQAEVPITGHLWCGSPLLICPEKKTRAKYAALHAARQHHEVLCCSDQAAS